MDQRAVSPIVPQPIMRGRRNSHASLVGGISSDSDSDAADNIAMLRDSQRLRPVAQMTIHPMASPKVSPRGNAPAISPRTAWTDEQRRQNPHLGSPVPQFAVARRASFTEEQLKGLSSADFTRADNSGAASPHLAVMPMRRGSISTGSGFVLSLPTGTSVTSASNLGVQQSPTTASQPHLHQSPRTPASAVRSASGSHKVLLPPIAQSPTTVSQQVSRSSLPPIAPGGGGGSTSDLARMSPKVSPKANQPFDGAPGQRHSNPFVLGGPPPGGAGSASGSTSQLHLQHQKQLQQNMNMASRAAAGPDSAQGAVPGGAHGPSRGGGGNNGNNGGNGNNGNNNNNNRYDNNNNNNDDDEDDRPHRNNNANSSSNNAADLPHRRLQQQKRAVGGAGVAGRTVGFVEDDSHGMSMSMDASQGEHVPLQRGGMLFAKVSPEKIQTDERTLLIFAAIDAVFIFVIFLCSIIEMAFESSWNIFAPIFGSLAMIFSLVNGFGLVKFNKTAMGISLLGLLCTLAAHALLLYITDNKHDSCIELPNEPACPTVLKRYTRSKGVIGANLAFHIFALTTGFFVRKRMFKLRKMKDLAAGTVAPGDASTGIAGSSAAVAGQQATANKYITYNVDPSQRDNVAARTFVHEPQP